MNNLNHYIRYILFTLFIGFLISNCSSESPPSKSPDLETVNLTKDLTISLDEAEEDILPGDFSGLAVSDDEKIYVADSRLQKIHIYSPEGDYINSIGRKGKGPGEFIALDPVIRILADTLYIKQNSSRLIDIFDLESQKHIRTITIPNKKINDVPVGSPRDLFPLSSGHLLISFTDPYYFEPEEDAPQKWITVSVINKNGEFVKENVIQSPVLFPTNQKLIYQESGAMHVFSGLSFYPRTFMGFNPDGIFYIGNSDSLLLKKYDLDGNQKGTLQENTSLYSFTNNDLDSASQENETLEKAIDQTGYPEKWPVFQNLIFDDHGYCWIQLMNPRKSEQTWWIFDENGSPKGKAGLPTDVDLYEIRKGKAYGILRPKDGVPSIVRYDIEDFSL